MHTKWKKWQTNWHFPVLHEHWHKRSTTSSASRAVCMCNFPSIVCTTRAGCEIYGLQWLLLPLDKRAAPNWKICMQRITQQVKRTYTCIHTDTQPQRHTGAVQMLAILCQLLFYRAQRQVNNNKNLPWWAPCRSHHMQYGSSSYQKKGREKKKSCWRLTG